MTDRELLDLAAKTANYEIERWDCWGFAQTKERERWNPLKDDGDALRLEVDTNITNKHRFQEILAEENTACNGNYRKARRRAIVRAAAEIGKAMK